jgi:hypothetical protein
MEAYIISAFVYKAIGTSVTVRHKETARGFLGLGPLRERWVDRRAQGITIINRYSGLLPTLSSAAAERTCTSRNASHLDCRLWALGAGISIPASPRDGLPNTREAMPAASASLEVRAVVGTAFVTINGEVVGLTVEAGAGPPRRTDELVSETTTQPSGGLQITCVTMSSETITPKTRRIEQVGGVLADGSTWRLSVAQAIAALKAGQVFYVERPQGDRVNVVVSVSATGREYIKTTADGDEPNNLLELPPCS